MFQVLFYQPIFNLLIFFFRLLGDNLGLAIIGVAFVSRLITYPLTNKQLKSAEKSKELQVEYDKIKKKYPKNKQKQQEEMAKLQAKYLPGQLSGCLPIIIQIIFLVQIRKVIDDLISQGVGAFNAVAYPFAEKFPTDFVVEPHFLEVLDLSKTANDIGLTNLSTVWPYILMAVAVGVSQLLSTLFMTGMRKQETVKTVKNEKKKKKQKAEEPDMATMMQNSTKQMMYILPIMTIFFSLNFIAGLSLYWTVQSFFVIIQQLIRERKKIAGWVKSRMSSDMETTLNT